MSIKLPDPAIQAGENFGEWTFHVNHYNEAQLKQCMRDVLDQAAQVAVDAVALTGGTVETEANVRAAIRQMIGDIK